MRRLAVLLFCAAALRAQPDWTNLNTGAGVTLFSVSFADRTTGYIGGDQGTLLKTTDGQNWTRLAIGTSDPVFAVRFLTRDVGVIAAGSRLLRTTDGGATWSVRLSAPGPLYALHFVTSAIGFASGDSGRVYRSGDAGETWSLVANNISRVISALFFVDPTTGFAAGETLSKTVDGGVTWTQVSTGIDDGLTCVRFLDRQIGYVSGYGGTLLVTQDGGASWRRANSGLATPVRAVLPLDRQRAVAVGDNGVGLATSDGGATWRRETTNTSATLLALTLSGGTLYAVGSNGVALRRDAGVAAPKIAGIGNAFDGSATLAPGILASIYGSDLAPATALATNYENGLLPAWAFDVSVTIAGRRAPLLYVSETQINVQAPYETPATNRVDVVVSYRGSESDARLVTFEPTAPALFPDGFHATGSRITPQDPAAPGEIVVFFATGQGVTAPASISGGMAIPPYPDPVAPVDVQIDGRAAEILFRGQTPGTVGVTQLNVRVPAGVNRKTNVQVLLRIGNREAKATTIPIG